MNELIHNKKSTTNERGSGGSIGGRWGRSPPYGVEIIFFKVVFLQK